MIFAPMQTGAGGLRPGWGRRVTDRLSSSATRAFPPHPGLGASSEAGGRGLTVTPESPPGGRRSRGSGRCPCGAAGSGQRAADVPAGCVGCGAQGLGAAGLPTSAHLSPPRPQPPPPLTQTSLSSLPASLSSECLSLWDPVLALSSFLCPLPFAARLQLACSLTSPLTTAEAFNRVVKTPQNRLYL